MPDPGSPATPAPRRPFTAADRLERILYILPVASQEGGAALEELAVALDVSLKTLTADITDVIARAYYHPAESGSDIQVHLYADRVEVFTTTGDFQRPVRLSLAEAVCLGLALRGAPCAEEPGAASAILTHLEEALVGADAMAFLAEVETADLRPGAAGIREAVTQCLQETTAVRIRYLKPDEHGEPEHRTVHPYALILAEGQWYLPAFCEAAQELRIFRMDRILEAVPTGAPFQLPPEFEPQSCIQGARVFRGGEETAVRVRYTPAIARWIAEHEEGEREADGGLVVTHPVADPHWLVRHVLQYGPDAEVLEPEEARAWMREGLSAGPG